MKRKTFVSTLFGISFGFLAIGILSNNIHITKITMGLGTLPFLHAVGYMCSLIPEEHRLVDMDLEK